jgi:ketosteroid isomerase-like protein
MADLDQRRRTVKVIELLDRSFAAYERGDTAARDALVAEALEVDAAAVSVIRGGMLIGEIPRPSEHPREWAEWVQAGQDELARAESDAEAWGGRGVSATYKDWENDEGTGGGGDG